MDFIKHLPVELMEMIVSHLDGDDILRCGIVCRDWKNILHGDRIWSILCRQRGWNKDDGEPTESWQECYWLNYNWRKGIYNRHHRAVPESGGLQVNLNRQFVITSHVMGSEVWKFDETCRFQQGIYCGDFHFQTEVTGKGVVIKLKNSIWLYTLEKGNDYYRLVKVISTIPESSDYDPDLKLDSAVLQTGSDRLVVTRKGIKSHKILMWNINDGFKYKPLLLEDDVKHIFKIIVSYSVLYLVTLNNNEYRIRICDLSDCRYRSLEVTAFKNVAFGVIPPEIQVSEKLIVAFCPTDIGRDLCFSYSPLKVWDLSGRFIGSVILDSGRIDYFAFCLSKDLVIFRSSESLVKVWKPETNEELCKISVKPEICKIDKTIGSLLVLSYERCFEVWDYKSSNRLYKVPMVDDVYTAIQDKIVINKYYYAKQDRNKKTVTVFSFNNEVRNCEGSFITDKPLPLTQICISNGRIM